MRGEVWMEIRNDRQKGLSYTEIARKYHIDPRTAKKYAESETKPVYNLSTTLIFIALIVSHHKNNVVEA